MDKRDFVMAYTVDKEFDSERFIKLRLRVCHDDESPNKTYFTKATMEDANKTLEYIPLLAHVYVDKETGKPVLGSHDMHIEEDKLNDGDTKIIYDEAPIGVVPSLVDNNCAIEEYEGLNYTFVDCYLWRDYANYAEQLVEDAVNTKLSMEIDFPEDALSYDATNKRYNISSYRYRGITLLNDSLGTGMKNAMATTEHFSADDIKSKMLTLMDELQKCLHEYNEKGGEVHMTLDELLAKYEVTIDEIDFDYEGLDEEALEAAFEDFACRRKKKCEEDPVPEAEPEPEPTPDPEPEEKFTKTFSVELSHEDVNYALYQLIGQYDEADNDYYYIRSVFDSYFIMQAWCSGKLYKQSYKIEESNVSFEGERQQMFEMILTESEKLAIDKMREDYAALESKYNELAQYKANMEQAQKDAIFASDKYVALKSSKAFAKLVEDAKNYSVGECVQKVDELFDEAKKLVEQFAVAKPVEKDSKPKTINIPFNVKESKKSPYGGLFK